MSPAPTPTPSTIPIPPLFESSQNTPTPHLPSAISNKYAILMITLISAAVILATVLGIVHYVRKRNARIIAARRHSPPEIVHRTQARTPDVEMAPRTNVPARPRRPESFLDKAMPPLPRVHSTVPSMYLARSSPLANNGVSAAAGMEVKPLSVFYQGRRGGTEGVGQPPVRV
ncbi:hypothetical protein CC86DRAFT_459242 [Ophiobolus disseminans]|uniref:Uncharacterized protein n=1 Tax=Ophiobolus disseminans TaxID=1469910 RepID=A0A6A6ZIW1_9PLEO|nr:hypothetical protein CC86DRAFT_459242 [Ophiobolus disseminans]